VSVPLTVGDTLVGVLSVGIADPARAFDSGDEHLLVLLAGHAAIAVTGARRLADQRASLVALSEADRRRSDMVAMITHDLKTPLTSLIGYVHLLRKRGEKVTAAERGGFYSHMDRQARRMLEMVEDLLVSSRVEQGASTLKRSRWTWAGSSRRSAGCSRAGRRSGASRCARPRSWSPSTATAAPSPTCCRTSSTTP
jgi:K+-sensing histidine kinase KdpD